MRPASNSQCCGKAVAEWQAHPQVDPQRASGQSLVHTWRRPGGPCGGHSHQALWTHVLPVRWGVGVWALALVAAGSANSPPAACGSESGVVSETPEDLGSTPTPTKAAALTSLCSLRSSSLKLLLTFMSCCTFASEVARAFLSSRYSCSVTAPSDRSEESMLCRVRHKLVSHQGQGTNALRGLLPAYLSPRPWL